MDNIIKQFNLPSYIKGKSFSKASELIQSKFKDREDQVSMDTMNSLLERLKEAQEFVKQQNELTTNQESFAMGGDLNSNPGMSNYIGAASTAMDFGNQIFGESGVDMTGEFEQNTTSAGMEIASGSMKGAQAGMAFGPWGAAAGAVIGGTAGLIGRNKKNDDIIQAQTNKILRNHNSSMNTYDKGGYINKYNGIDNVPTYMNNKLGGEAPLDFSSFSSPKTDYNSASLYGADNNDEYFKSKLSNIGLNNNSENELENSSSLKNIGSFLNNNKSTLRYAPLAMNAYQSATMKKPDVEKLDRLGNKYEKQYVDERSLMNSITEGFGTGRSLEGSGGSLARYSTLNRANQLNKTKSISDAYLKTSNINNNENKTAQNFNLNIDRFNIGQTNKEMNINAQNKGAYDTQKSKYLSSIGTDIGQIGKEYLYKEQASDIYGYDWKGKYIKTNPNATEEELEDAYKKFLSNQKNT